MFTPTHYPRRPGVVAPARVDPEGLAGPTPGQARGRHWVRTSPGLFVPATADLQEPEQRIVAAAGVLRPGECVTGWGSLRWREGRWFDGTSAAGLPRPVPLHVRRHLVRHPSYRLSQEHVPPPELDEVDGLPVASARCSVCFEARWAGDLVAAVVAVDMAAYSDLVSLAELAPYVHSRMAPTGIEQARQALALAVENSWSPQETVMRLVWRGWSPASTLLCNCPVFDVAGRHLGTPDLLDPVSGVAGEYEGGVHLEPRRRASDVRREATLRDVGLEVVTMVGADRTDDHRSFLARLAAAHARAAAQPGERRWTIEQPAWWTDTSTVAARRALDPLLRRRLLAYRRTA